MLKTTVLRQKQEKERLLSLPYVERIKIKTAQKWLKSDLIKVVLGPRRAGKSVFSLMLLKELPFAYFNFDDGSLSGEGKLNLDELIQELRTAYGETNYILLDEIQNLPDWELFAGHLQREGYNLILTGSNARLLSMEMATALTGRHIPIEILPFNFKEYLRARQYEVSSDKLLLPSEKGQFMRLLEQYLLSGGYPEVVVKNLDAHDYLAVLFDSLLFKDVVKRHKVRFTAQIDNLAAYLINNVANLYSLRKLTHILEFKSGVTLEKYVSYLVEAYLMFSLSRYSFKAGERLKSPQKLYVVDNGFISAKAVQHTQDWGKLMENLVFTELIKRGHQPNRNLFYYRTRNNREIDFVCREGNTISGLIQVCYEITDQIVEQREVKALTAAAKEVNAGEMTVLTWNTKKETKVEGATINFRPLWEWLIEDL
jgi:predicted AAA+ superfamily ATPase